MCVFNFYMCSRVCVPIEAINRFNNDSRPGLVRWHGRVQWAARRSGQNKLRALPGPVEQIGCRGELALRRVSERRGMCARLCRGSGPLQNCAP